MIRAATIEDHRELVKLARSSIYTKDFSNAMLFSSPEAYAKGWIRVLEEPGSEIAGMTCRRDKVREPLTELYFIVVHPTARSLGIGEQLLKDLFYVSPHSKVGLNVMKENTGAVRFYTRHGLKIVGVGLGGKAWRMEGQR